MNIAGLDLSKEILLIAEIGNNHEGDFELAKRMIALAAASGAAAVKFQSITPEHLVRPTDTKRLEQLRRFAFRPEQFAELAQVARDEGVAFLSTPFDVDCLDWLDDLVPAYKIASGDNNFFPLLESVARLGKPVLLSTGLSSFDEIAESVDAIRRVWRKELRREEVLSVLHCVCSYPTPDEEASVGAVRHLASLGVVPGYSDHTLGVEAAVLSVAAGARVIEKHFTIDKQYSGFRDHQLSADPEEFALLAERVQRANELVGTGLKELQVCEQANVEAVRRSIVAKHALSEGDTLSIDDLLWLRPGTGLPPGDEGKLVGRKLRTSKTQGEEILEADVKED